MNSMTGYGSASASSNELGVTAELKTVNNRYFDFSARLPSDLQDKELAIKKIIQAEVERGSVTVRLQLTKAETGKPKIAVNKALAKGYGQMLSELRAAADVEAHIRLQDLLSFDEIFEPRERDAETLKTIWTLSQQAIKKALQKLMTMRANEGAELKKDLAKHARLINEEVAKVKTQTENRAAESRDALRQRIDNLIEKGTLDDDRLEMEVAILVDKMDVTEELVRIESHIKYFEEALAADEPVGRRLKFLSQELNREINTIGSKVNSADISQHVVAAKEYLEKIREQVQNVE